MRTFFLIVIIIFLVSALQPIFAQDVGYQIIDSQAPNTLTIRDTDGDTFDCVGKISDETCKGRVTPQVITVSPTPPPVCGEGERLWVTILRGHNRYHCAP